MNYALFTMQWEQRRQTLPRIYNSSTPRARACLLRQMRGGFYQIAPTVVRNRPNYKKGIKFIR